jgi:hypothetical protein
MLNPYNHFQTESPNNRWSDYLTNANEPRRKYSQNREHTKGNMLVDSYRQKHMFRVYAEKLRHELR